MKKLICSLLILYSFTAKSQVEVTTTYPDIATAIKFMDLPKVYIDSITKVLRTYITSLQTQVNNLQSLIAQKTFLDDADAMTKGLKSGQHYFRIITPIEGRIVVETKVK